MLLVCFIVACQPAKKNLATDQEEYYKLQIEETLGGKPEYLPSEKGNYLLCKRVDKSNANQIDFLIYDLLNGEILYQKRLIAGNVEWEDSRRVKIVQTLGNRTKDYPEGFRTYYYDAREKRIIEGSSKNK